jgi:hypothetical protein
MYVQTEKSKIPESMVYAARITECRARTKVRKSRIDELYALMAPYQEELDLLDREDEWDAQNARRAAEGRAPLAPFGVDAVVNTVVKEEKKEKGYQFVCPCPHLVAGSTEQCRGAIMKSTMRCAVCHGRICRDCREPRFEDNKGKSLPHTCDENTVATILALKDDTKPCPNCAASIFRISGCNQMWCTQCHTAFDWRTNLKIDGPIHNPHAMEYRRQNQGPQDPNVAVGCAAGARTLDMIDCGEIILPTEIPFLAAFVDVYDDNAKQRYSPKCNKQILFTLDYFHVVADVVRLIEINRPNEDNINRELNKQRLNYVLGDISEKLWCDRIHRIHRQTEKKRILRDIYVTFRDLGADTLRNLAGNLANAEREIPKHGKFKYKRFRQEYTMLAEQHLSPYLTSFLLEMGKLSNFINQTLKTEMSYWGSCKTVDFLIVGNNDSIQWKQTTPPDDIMAELVGTSSITSHPYYFNSSGMPTFPGMPVPVPAIYPSRNAIAPSLHAPSPFPPPATFQPLGLPMPTVPSLTSVTVPPSTTSRTPLSSATTTAFLPIPTFTPVPLPSFFTPSYSSTSPPSPSPSPSPSTSPTSPTSPTSKTLYAPFVLSMDNS